MKNKNLWFKETKNKNRIKLLCFPYAGGGASKYSNWQSELENIEVLPIQLPGRENRMNEKLVTNSQQLIIEISELIFQELREEEFAFFGHSMGGIFAYEISKYLINNFNLSPKMCFLSGTSLKMKNYGEKMCEKSDEEFLDSLLSYGGFDSEILKYPEFVEMFLKIIRADYKLIENSNFTNEKISVPIKSYSGKNDQIVQTLEVLTWANYTEKYLGNQEFEGNHFFCFKNYKKICQDINQQLYWR